jgi:hypothetical protein
MEVLTVVWSSGSCDDHGNAHSFAGVHGIYKSEKSAKQGLEECKNEIYEEALNTLDPDNEFPDVRSEVQVYGSVEDGYFEVDYTIGTEPVEIYIGLVHGFVQD